MPITIEDLDDDIMSEAAPRVWARMDRLQVSLLDIARRHGSSLETEERQQAYEAREMALAALEPGMRATPGTGLERHIGKSNDLLSYEFLERGMLAGQAVGCVDVEPFDLKGTGFLVAPDVVLTNHHVLPNAITAQAGVFKLGFESDSLRVFRSSPVDLVFRPDRLFVTDESHDCTFVAVDTTAMSEETYWLPLLKERGKIVVGHPVCIIQHPEGRIKHVVVHNSHLLDLEDGGSEGRYCWYTSDTEEGSSGAPVFNSRWEVIALHRKAVPRTNRNNEILDIHGKVMTRERFEAEPSMVDWIANEGVRISRIVQFLETAACEPDHDAVRLKVLAQWQHPLARHANPKQGWLA